MTYLMNTPSYPALHASVRASQQARSKPSQTEGQRSYGREDARAATPWLVMFRWIMLRLLGRDMSGVSEAEFPAKDHTDGANRGKRCQQARFTKRTAPASRKYIPRIFFHRDLTRAQWMAKDAALSGYGIVKANGIAYRTPRRMQEYLMALLGFNDGVNTPCPRVKGGLTRVQLPPD